MKSLTIRKLFRSGAGIPEDELNFELGVNVLVGRPNTGKTKWLQMLNYVFGSEKTPADVFGDDLADKFDLIRATLAIDGEDVVVERRWKEPGNRAKVFLDGEPFGAREFCAELLRRLGIPLLHYPQGDPFGKRTWPELSWRSLLRHIYRRQHFWSDLADNQPTSEQHASILQFLGVAEHLYSAEFGELVEKQKRIYELQLAKDQFLNMLHEVSRELLDEEDRGVALTPESIQSAISRVRDEILAAQSEREGALTSLTSAAGGSGDGRAERLTIFTEQSERLTQLRDKSESILRARKEIETRVERAADWLSDGMNNYLTAINKRQEKAWPQGKVEVRLRERNFNMTVGGGKWSAKLGGTLSLYFLISYHYGLLSLFSRPECHYPGLLILDFPPELEDGSSVKDKENFILEPFVELATAEEFSKIQIIAAGSAFEKLAGANRIELTNVWTGM